MFYALAFFLLLLLLDLLLLFRSEDVLRLCPLVQDLLEEAAAVVRAVEAVELLELKRNIQTIKRTGQYIFSPSAFTKLY